MKIRNILKGGVVLAGLAGFVSVAAPASADTLQSPDSDALVAGYQIIQFNLKECMAISGSGSMANGTGLVSPSIRKIAGKMCSEFRVTCPSSRLWPRQRISICPQSFPMS